MGMVEKPMLLEDGDVLELDRTSAVKTGKVTVGRVCIDSGGLDRRGGGPRHPRPPAHLGEGGIVLPIITINKRTGKVENTPEIVIRGFAIDDEHDRRVAAGGAADTGQLRRGREGRLRRDQGEDPQRSEAVHPEEHQPPPIDYAGNSGDLTGISQAAQRKSAPATGRFFMFTFLLAAFVDT